MKRLSLFAVLGTLLLSACAPSQQAELMKNPLYAMGYHNKVVDTLTNLIIVQDPITTQTGAIAMIQKEVAKHKIAAQDAEILYREGYAGSMMPVAEDTAGIALYLDDTLYFSPDFYVDAGPDLRVYMIPDVDPRGMMLPNDTVLDLGPLKSFYGTQFYDVPHQAKPELLRSLVIWDVKMKRMHAFAQLGRTIPTP